MSTLVSRNVRINGRRTSVKLEPAMWEALAEICAREGIGIGQLCTGVSGQRAQSSFTSALRVFIVDYYRTALADAKPSGRIGAPNESSIAPRTVTGSPAQAGAGWRAR